MSNFHPIKDHYQTLQVAQDASQEEIKKSFRRLAHEYHPDKNPQDLISENHFREIMTAYRILSDTDQRKKYDEERWLSGKFKRRTVNITPAFLNGELDNLRAQLKIMDLHRMNKELLHEYLLFLLSDEKVSVMRKHASAEEMNHYGNGILETSKLLPVYFAQVVLRRLIILTEAESGLNANINARIKQLNFEAKLQQYYPWFIVLITVIICLGMYWYASLKNL